MGGAISSADDDDPWLGKGALHELRRAWSSGRPIVPIFGAGISVDAGIPAGPALTEFLHDFEALCRLTHTDLRRRLETRGWPAWAELGTELRAHGCTPRRPFAEQPAKRPVEQWVDCLHRLTGKQAHLKEAFFDGLVRGRAPSTSHRMIAFLTRRLGIRLLLTTNFDDLLEDALRAEAQEPVVYEIARGGSLPHQSLVRRHLSLIKLNGGKFGLCAGPQVRQPLSKRQLATFVQYVPPDALLLVIGQRDEPRVVSLLEALAKARRADERFIVWVHHPPTQRAPLQLKSAEPYTWHVACDDAALFLQELYWRCHWSHPAGRVPYRALFHVPEIAHRRAGQPTDGTSAGSAAGIRLWFNLYEFTSFAAFLSALVERLESYDRALPPLMLSPSVAFPTLGASRDSNWKELWLDYVEQALQRQVFDIQLDLLSAFSNSHPAHPFAVPGGETEHAAERQLKALADFVRELTKRDLGGSRIQLVCAEPGSSRKQPNGTPAELQVREELKDQRRLFRDVRRPPRVADPVAWATSLFESLEQGPKWRLRLVEAACSLRRPRSIVALMRLACYQHPREVEPSDPSALVAGKEIEGELAALVKQGVLIPQAGGTFSMTSATRNVLYQYFVANARGRALELQEKAALYYRCDLHEQSRDWAAFIEYAFHRMASTSGDEQQEPQAERLDWLRGALAREGSSLSGRGHTSALLDLLSSIHSKVRSSGLDQTPAGKRLRFEAQRLEADVLRQASCFSASSLLYSQVLSQLPPVTDDRSDRCLEALDSAFGRTEILLALADSYAHNDEPNPARDRLEDAKQALAQARSVGTSSESYLRLFGDREASLWTELTAMELELDLESICRWGHPAHAPPKDARLTGHDGRFDETVARLASHPSGPHADELRCRLRCAYARSLYLRGEFRAADKELNRAHAFSPRQEHVATHSSSATYHAHRAEHALLQARFETGGSVKHRLLKSALVALEQTERALRVSQRNVLWWSRMFVLRARVHLELLLLLQADGTLARHAPGADPGAWPLQREQWVLGCLRAVAGGLRNTIEARPRAALDQLWDELWLAWSDPSAAEPSPAASGQSTDQHWRHLNRLANLERYAVTRETRFLPGNLFARLALDGAPPVALVDVSTRGMAVRAELERGQQLEFELTDERGKHRQRLSGKVVHVGKRKSRVCFVPLDVSARIALARFCDKARRRNPKRRARGPADQSAGSAVERRAGTQK